MVYDRKFGSWNTVQSSEHISTAEKEERITEFFRIAVVTSNCGQLRQSDV
jgi:hypothetical protein